MRRLLERSGVLAAAGALIAFLATMCGIGGGLFCVPLLHFGVGLPLRRSVATGLCLVLANACASTVTELTRETPRLDAWIAAATVAGALAGTQLGYRISQRIGRRALRGVFAVVLAVAGLRVVASGSAAPLGAGAAEGAGALGIALLAGLGGGTLAPLLGIGGGLVVTPALFLGVPGLGFGGARACSMAVAVATSGRSLWLYAREGAVDWRRGRSLAAGAVGGAVLGVVAVHRPGWTEAARVLLGGCLLFVAARFALELAREGRGPAGQA